MQDMAVTAPVKNGATMTSTGRKKVKKPLKNM